MIITGSLGEELTHGLEPVIEMGDPVVLWRTLMREFDTKPAKSSITIKREIYEC